MVPESWHFHIRSFWRLLWRRNRFIMSSVNSTLPNPNGIVFGDILPPLLEYFGQESYFGGQPPLSVAVGTFFNSRTYTKCPHRFQLTFSIRIRGCSWFRRHVLYSNHVDYLRWQVFRRCWHDQRTVQVSSRLRLLVVWKIPLFSASDRLVMVWP